MDQWLFQWVESSKLVWHGLHKNVDGRFKWLEVQKCEEGDSWRKIKYEKGLRVQAVVAMDNIVAHNYI